MNPRDLNSMLIGYEGKQNLASAKAKVAAVEILARSCLGGVIQWDMKDKTAVNTFELTLPPGELIAEIGRVQFD